MTEFVPLPFVPMETPIHLRGLSRMGPTFREAVLMHAVARLVLHPLVTNIQTSWVKMGAEGAAVLARGRQRFGGHLDERKHYAGRRRRPWRGDAAGSDGSAGRVARPDATAAHDLLRRSGPGQNRHIIRRGAVAADHRRPPTITQPFISVALRKENRDGRKQKMDFGICLPTKAKSFEVVKRAEEFGLLTPGSTTRTC